MSAVVRRLAECTEEGVGTPAVPVRTSFDRTTGCPRLVQRQMRLPPPGRARRSRPVAPGNIPPSRAPLHEHTYDEVVMVLEGHGVVHVDGRARR